MEPYADVNCILKVSVDCEACRMKMVEVLSSIIGVYSVDIDAHAGIARVSGEVDPNILLRALARSGKHAEIACVKLKHPVVSRGPYGLDHGCGYGYGYAPGALEDHHHPIRGALPTEYPRYASNYYHGSSYPPRHSYAHQSSNYCSIM